MLYLLMVTVKWNPAALSLTTGFICQMHRCVAFQMYNSRFVPFVFARSLPVAYFLRSAPSSVPPKGELQRRSMWNLRGFLSHLAFTKTCIKVRDNGLWVPRAVRGGIKRWDKLTTTAKCWCFTIRTHRVAAGGTKGVFVAEAAQIASDQKAV